MTHFRISIRQKARVRECYNTSGFCYNTEKGCSLMWIHLLHKSTCTNQNNLIMMKHPTIQLAFFKQQELITAFIIEKL